MRISFGWVIPLTAQPPRSYQELHLNMETRFQVNTPLLKKREDRDRVHSLLLVLGCHGDTIVPVMAWRSHQTTLRLSSSPGSILTRPGPALAVRVFCSEAAPSETPRWLLALSSMQVIVPGPFLWSLSTFPPLSPPPNPSPRGETHISSKG